MFVLFKGIFLMKKIKCVLIGLGNIGIDLLYKLCCLLVFEFVWMVGVDLVFDGFVCVCEFGLKIIDKGVDGLLLYVVGDEICIVFDVMLVYVYCDNFDKFIVFGVKMIDLMFVVIGLYCVLLVNFDVYFDSVQMNVNMVICGGQVMILMVYVVLCVQLVVYGEIVVIVLLCLVGFGMCKNIDEFMCMMFGVIEQVGGVCKGKVIIVINLVELLLIMCDMIYCLIDGLFDVDVIIVFVYVMVKEV